MATMGHYVYDWPRPMVTADAAVLCTFAGIPKLLLIKRRNDPFKDHWALPGGFLEMDEELEDCAARELQEETGLSRVPLEQLHTFGRVGRDPRGRLITVVFIGVTEPENAAVQGNDDAAEARWFPLDAIPQPTAFDHDVIVAKVITRHQDRPHPTSRLSEQRLQAPPDNQDRESRKPD